MNTAAVYADALRAHARGLHATEAAVELLIAHGVWLRRRDFFHRFMNYTDNPPRTGGEPIAYVRWDRVVAAIAAGAFLPCSAGELQVVQCAAGLAGYGQWSLRDAINSLDFENLTLVMQAMAHLRGWHERGRRATITGDVGGRVS